MAKPFRLYVCSDLHASERSWRKFVNAMRANVYGVDAAVIAGDLTGKALIAVVKGEHGGEAWTASILGQRRVARDEQELLGLERSIADLGYYAVRVTETERAAMEADPDLVRSYFHDQIAKRVREWMTLAAERLDGSGVPVYLMPGNDDEFEIDAILAESMYCRNVNEQVVELTPWHQLVSMGWSSPTPWSTPRGPVGSTGVRRAIERFRPVLGVHGHIHESGGERRIGDTVCVNAGSEASMGILRGYLVDLTENGVERPLRVEG